MSGKAEAVGDLAIDRRWREVASCRQISGEYFFSPTDGEERKDRQERERLARALCERCPVRQQCLDWALETGEQHGIWGGLNGMERRRLLRASAVPAEKAR